MTHKISCPAALLCLSGMLGCTNFVPPASPAVPSKFVERTPPATQNPGLAADTDIARLVQGNNQFACNLYTMLAQQPGNKFFSPWSISSALAMTYAGARTKTAAEMAQTLHFPVTDQRLHAAFADLVQQMRDDDGARPYRLQFVNAMWRRLGLEVRPEFLATAQAHYGAGLEALDFAGDPEGSRAAINRWVAEQTDGKIHDLLEKDMILPATRLVLTNAVHFQSHWQTPFDPRLTQVNWFRAPQQLAVRVPYMNCVDDFGYHEDAARQIVQVPYRGNELALIVMLPRKMDGLAQLESKLSARQLAGELAKLSSAKVDLKLPKFKMTESFRLRKTLANMGLRTAFDDAADFSGLTMSERVKIDDVIHKAHVDVDENGTEAAAAAEVTFPGLAANKDTLPVRAVDFKADHPFLFLIRHNATGSILFLGRVCAPHFAT